MMATHLPVVLDLDGGAHGTLEGHRARANPHARETPDDEALVIFSGPNAYGKVVPTWNYIAVHAISDALH